MKKIPEGYKKTEIGVIPNDWDCNKVEEMVDVIGGGTPSTKVPKYWNGKIDWFTPTEIGRKKYAYQSKRKLTEEGLINSSAKILNEGTVLLTSRAGIGDLAILKIKACTNQGFQSLSPHEAIDSEFLYYLMLTKKKELLERASGSTFLEISPNNVRNILIQVPKKQEQTAIVTVLSDTDALIEHLEKLIAKKKAIKQGTMQQLLTGKKRLPGFSGEWKVKKLGEVAEMSSGGTPLTSNNSYYGGQIPWVVIADMTRIEKYLFNTEKNITELGLEFSSAKLLKKGTLLFAMYASIGKCAIAKVDITFNQAILGIKTKKIDTEFLYYYLAFNEQKFLQMGQAGTQNNLNKEIVQNLDIPYPYIEEQTAIATILSDMDADVERLEKKRDKYTMLKQGMMQQLLTGRIRIYANN